ncbi:MAG: hypothetical protein WCG83_02955 [Candidatus Peregrinibacteria bacterium]
MRFHTLLDFLFPRRSLGGSEGESITEEERRHLGGSRIVEDRTELQKRGIFFLDRLVAASAFAESPLLRKAIHTFKYGRVRSLADELSELMVRAAPSTVLTHPVLCPVPLHWSRLFSRGFNQSALLAHVIAQRRGLRYQSLLRRIRPTGTQTKRNRAQRLTALIGAFRCCEPSLPSFVILIDDLSTTGATMDACAKELKKCGVARVEGWVIAHG